MDLMKLIPLIGALFFATSAYAIVDMKSANYSETYTTMQVPGVGYDLRVALTYNSRSLFNGKFGYGWCSDFETTLTKTPEGALKLTECGAGQEINFMPNSFKPGAREAAIKEIMAKVKEKRSDLKPDYLANLEKEMQTNEYLREEFAKRLGVQKRVVEGEVFYANGREAETVILKGGVYKRSIPDGTYQLFDAQGHMTHMYDKNSNYLKLSWDKDLLMSVADNAGRKLTFKYNPTTKKVTDVTGPNGLYSHFVMKGEDLTEISSKKEKYEFAYDDVHNLTRIDYPDKTYKALTYNKDKDWVTSFRNQKGCVEKYEYEVSKDEPRNHFWSNVVKTCGTKVTNKSQYEFFHKNRPDGLGMYLYRVKADNNGDVTDIVYHETFGKPLSILRNGIRTEYTYYPNGFVHTKTEPGRLLTYDYKNTCNKVSNVNIDYFKDGETKTAKGKDANRKVSSAKSMSVVKNVKTKFFYDAQKCNLSQAENSDGQKIKLQYDGHGRIAQIEDQSKKLVNIKYEEHFGKPATVTRPGLGTIFVSYKTDGEISKVESKEGPQVAMQVASIFNNLLDIIAPATAETPL
jgi:YD repeat-containing protein